MKNKLTVLATAIATSLLSISSSAYAYSEDNFGEHICDHMRNRMATESQQGTLTTQQWELYTDSLNVCLEMVGIRNELWGNYIFRTEYRTMPILTTAGFVYSEPDLTSFVIETLPVLREVYVVQIAKAIDNDDMWYQIVMSDYNLSSTGWLHESAFIRSR